MKQLEILVKERDTLLAALADKAAQRIRERVLPLPFIQKRRGDTALIFWLDVRSEHLGCVLRRQQPPLRLVCPAPGKDSPGPDDDGSLPRRVLQALADGREGDAAARRQLLAELPASGLVPLETASRRGAGNSGRGDWADGRCRSRP